MPKSDREVRRDVSPSLMWLRGAGFRRFLIAVFVVVSVAYFLTGLAFLSPTFGRSPSAKACRRFQSGCPDFRHTSTLLCWLVVICCVLTIGDLVERSGLSSQFKKYARRFTFSGWFSRLDDGPRSLCFVFAGSFTAFVLGSVIDSSINGGLSKLPWLYIWAARLCWLVPVVFVLAVVANRDTIVRRGFSSELTTIFIVAVLVIGVAWAGWTLNGLAETSAIVAIATGLARWMKLRPFKDKRKA